MFMLHDVLKEGGRQQTYNNVYLLQMESGKVERNPSFHFRNNYVVSTFLTIIGYILNNNLKKTF